MVVEPATEEMLTTDLPEPPSSSGRKALVTSGHPQHWSRCSPACPSRPCKRTLAHAMILQYYV